MVLNLEEKILAIFLPSFILATCKSASAFFRTGFKALINLLLLVLVSNIPGTLAISFNDNSVRLIPAVLTVVRNFFKSE